MNQLIKKFAALFATAALTLSLSASAVDSVKILIPAAPGGGWDTTGRALGQAMVKAGAVKAIQYDNKGGAGGTIGLAQFINTSKGDGGALMMGGMVMVGGILLNKSAVNLGMVTPLARLTGEYLILVVPSNSPIKSMKDLVDKYKADPGSVSWGGGSAGGSDHILAGMIVQAAGADPAKVNYIAYAGGGETQAAILGGHLTLAIAGYSEFAGQIKSGKLRPIGISSDKRIPGIDIPTLREQGIPTDLFNWRGIFAAPGITDAQKKELITALDTTIKSPGWKETLVKQEWNDIYLTGDAFNKYLEDENKRIGDILTKIALKK